MIRGCPKCGWENTLPTKIDPKSYVNPPCAKCGANLFPRLDQKNKYEGNLETDGDVKEEGSLKRFFWPSITSKKDSESILTVVGIILAGWLAFIFGLSGLIDESPLYFPFVVFFIYAGFEITRENYWPVPIISVVGVLEFTLIFYILVQSDGTTGTRFMVLRFLAACASITLFRAWYLSKQEKSINYSSNLKSIFSSHANFQKGAAKNLIWIKQNKIILIIVVGLLTLIFSYTQMNQPSNYNQCVIDKLNESKNAEVAKQTAYHIRSECRRKFPKINRFGDTVLSKGLVPIQ